jgi:hypothetical protein
VDANQVVFRLGAVIGVWTSTVALADQQWEALTALRSP